MKTLIASAVIAASVLVSICVPAKADWSAHLTMRSEAGDYVGGGTMWNLPRDWNLYYGKWNSEWHDVKLADSEVSFVLGTITSLDSTFVRLTFNTTKLGTPLETGDYPDAVQVPFATAGHPGIEISFQSRAADNLLGRFSITELTRDAQDQLRTFAITFEQHVQGNPAALTGTFTYDSGVPVPEPSTLLLAVLGTISLVLARRGRRS
jgi:hypothetical protein